MTIPGIGPITATALIALAPVAETFAKGRDFAAWLGLAPLQRSTGGKQKLGATSKMGERTLRRLLIIGSSAVVHQASRRGAPKGSWLEQMLAAKAPHAGDGGAGQQDGAHRLGPSGEGRKLPSSGGGHGVEPGSASEAVGDARSVEGGYGTTVGETGPEEPVLSTVPASTLWVTWFRSANSHTGPAAKSCSRGRTDGSNRHRAYTPKATCVPGGVHRWKADEPLVREHSPKADRAPSVQVLRLTFVDVGGWWPRHAVTGEA